jgi:hypothetical protein
MKILEIILGEIPIVKFVMSAVTAVVCAFATFQILASGRASDYWALLCCVTIPLTVGGAFTVYELLKEWFGSR